MTKELFLDSVKILQEYTEWEHKLYELGINFWERKEISNLVTSYIELLEDACKDKPAGKYDPSNTSYFVYECEFGKYADKYFITEADGTKVKFYTAEDLWGYLVKNHPEIESR